MSTAKVAITLDRKTVAKLDRMVKKRIFPNRSKAIQEAVEEKFERIERSRLARECSKLDPHFEKAMAEEDSQRIWIHGRNIERRRRLG